MKNSVGTLIFVVAAVLLSSLVASAQSSTALAQDMNAANIQETCAHWAKLHVDKHNQFKGNGNDLYNTGFCLGYFRGSIDGMDNTGGWRLPNDTVARFEINRAAINSTLDITKAFSVFVDSVPLSKGKPAWQVLQAVLMSNGLAGFIPETPPSEPTPQSESSNLSEECKIGATSVITQFSSDNDLKGFDTPTLASALAKLADCSGTTSLSNSDNALIFMAQAQIERVLLVRAANVIGRHSLLPEFQLDRSSVNASIGQQ